MHYTEKLVKTGTEAHAALSASPRPLKRGEKHCPFCEGYGWNPSGLNNGNAVRCHECRGTGIASY